MPVRSAPTSPVAPEHFVRGAVASPKGYGGGRPAGAGPYRFTPVAPPSVIDRLGLRRVVARLRRPTVIGGRTVPRHAVVGVIWSAAAAGLLFGPAFGSLLAAGVWVPIVAVAVAANVAHAAARRWPWLRFVRLPLAALLGLAAISETALGSTTSSGIPTAATLHQLEHGVTQSWLFVLQSTSPVRTEPELLVFVPELVLLAALVGAELLLWSKLRLVAIVPSLVVIGIAEAFRPVGTLGAVFAMLIYAGAVSMTLGARPVRPSNRTLFGAAAVIVVGSLIAGAVDFAGQRPFSLRDHVPSVSAPAAGAPPLDDIAYLLMHPNQPAFSVQGTPGIERWPVDVLNRFDGSGWTSREHLRYLGANVDSPRPTAVPSVKVTASVLIDKLPGPWLPDQQGVVWLSPLHAVINENNGTLLAHDVHPFMRYQLQFESPQATRADFLNGKLDLHAAGRCIITTHVPETIREIARAAVGDRKPSIATALVLERFMQRNHSLAVAPNLPSGSSWSALIHFLAAGSDDDPGSVTPNSGGAGTSEQFAAAYVALAHVIGIPARLVVGFRQPKTPAADGNYVIRNRDVLAWPEIAVQGIGWVPLDPEGLPGKGNNDAQSVESQALAAARAALTPSGQLPHDTTAAPPPVDTSTGKTTAQWLHQLVVLLLMLIGLSLIAVPAAKYVRSLIRRRQIGNAAVLSAWREACDRLVDNGVDVRRSMTVRDITESAAALADWHVVRAVGELGELVDDALWSGDRIRPSAVTAAWRAVDAVQGQLASRPISERLAALLTIRSLRAIR